MLRHRNRGYLYVDEQAVDDCELRSSNETDSLPPQNGAVGPDQSGGEAQL